MRALWTKKDLIAATNAKDLSLNFLDKINGVSGISLITAPSYLFDYLNQVAPNVKKVHVAYSSKSAWLIELAKIAAVEKNLKLNLKLVSSTAEAIDFYQQLFDR